jgi:hypothetical protein
MAERSYFSHTLGFSSITEKQENQNKANGLLMLTRNQSKYPCFEGAKILSSEISLHQKVETHLLSTGVRQVHDQMKIGLQYLAEPELARDRPHVSARGIQYLRTQKHHP